MADKVTRTDGALVTITSIEKGQGQWGPTVKATGVDANGDEFSEYVTPTQGKNLVTIEDILPQKLRVAAFKAKLGPGFRFEAPNAEA